MRKILFLYFLSHAWSILTSRWFWQEVGQRIGEFLKKIGMKILIFLGTIPYFLFLLLSIVVLGIALAISGLIDCFHWLITKIFPGSVRYLGEPWQNWQS
jgi:hypothetical protein